ncbi:hypothetical protein HanRHA438_Chr06g0274441 [Helianthus annuus]|nr:hypothetical protein HanRHA438_Chr06g0274441 [Helianthus annuus]
MRRMRGTADDPAFVNSERNRQHLLRSLGYDALDDLLHFDFDIMFDMYKSVQGMLDKYLDCPKNFDRICFPYSKYMAA